MSAPGGMRDSNANRGDGELLPNFTTEGRVRKWERRLVEVGHMKLFRWEPLESRQIYALDPEIALESGSRSSHGYRNQTTRSASARRTRRSSRYGGETLDALPMSSDVHLHGNSLKKRGKGKRGRPPAAKTALIAAATQHMTNNDPGNRKNTVSSSVGSTGGLTPDAYSNMDSSQQAPTPLHSRTGGKTGGVESHYNALTHHHLSENSQSAYDLSAFPPSPGAEALSPDSNVHHHYPDISPTYSAADASPEASAADYSPVLDSYGGGHPMGEDSRSQLDDGYSPTSMYN